MEARIAPNVHIADLTARLSSPHRFRLYCQSRGTRGCTDQPLADRKSTRLNSSHLGISYAVLLLSLIPHDLTPFPTRRSSDLQVRGPTSTVRCPLLRLEARPYGSADRSQCSHSRPDRAAFVPSSIPIVLSIAGDAWLHRSASC